MQKIRYLIIALMCMVVQGAWAQTEVSTEAALTTDYGYNGIEADDPNSGTGVRSFVLNFGDEGETTGIISTTNFTNYTNSDDAWYDLQGRKIVNRTREALGSSKKLPKGVYIHNGQKKVIK